MKIDLHVHCAERSSCSNSSEEEMVQQAIKSGLDAIVLTDHHRHAPKENLAMLNSKYAPFKVFGGIEMTLPNRKSHITEDFLIYGVDDPVLEEREDWSYEDLYDLVRKNNGYLILAHPLRYHDYINEDIKSRTPDGIEVNSGNIGRCDWNHINEIIKSVGSKAYSNSDAHNAADIGLYHMELPCEVRNEGELLEVLKMGTAKMCVIEEKVKKINEAVYKREKYIKELISQGKNADDYHKETGGWTGPFDRVKSGKSYII